jgi:hypothetical protein
MLLPQIKGNLYNMATQCSPMKVLNDLAYTVKVRTLALG